MVYAVRDSVSDPPAPIKDCNFGAFCAVVVGVRVFEFICLHLCAGSSSVPRQTCAQIFIAQFTLYMTSGTQIPTVWHFDDCRHHHSAHDSCALAHTPFNCKMQRWRHVQIAFGGHNTHTHTLWPPLAISRRAALLGEWIMHIFDHILARGPIIHTHLRCGAPLPTVYNEGDFYIRITGSAHSSIVVVSHTHEFSIPPPPAATQHTISVLYCICVFFL